MSILLGLVTIVLVQRTNLIQKENMETVSRVIDGFEVTVDKVDEDLLFGYPWKLTDFGYFRCYKPKKFPLETSSDRYLYLHRLILQRKLGHDNSELCDHKDRVKTNNCRDNLRPATELQNGINKTELVNNTTGYKGVTYQKGKYMVETSVDDHLVYLGRYFNKETAAFVYNEFVQARLGEYAWLNPLTEEDIKIAHKEILERKNFKRGLTQRASGNWTANIKVDGKLITLGSSKTQKRAAQIYNLAAIYYHGSKAILNSVDML